MFAHCIQVHYYQSALFIVAFRLYIKEERGINGTEHAALIDKRVPIIRRNFICIKNWIWYSFYGNANDYRDKSGETRSLY